MDEWTKNCGKSAVIMQMMKKMGYVKGMGLGAKKQGIVEPICAKLRIGRTALGYQQGEEVETESKFRVYGKDDHIFGNFVDHDDTIHESVKQTWKKASAKKEKRHKTLEDILDDEIICDGNSFKSPVQPYGKIIDLTGPKEKIYEDFTSYYEYSNSREGIQPDTLEGSSKLINLIEKEIRRNGKEFQFLKNQTYGLKDDRDNLEREIVLGRVEILRMEEMMAIIKRSLPVLANSTSALEECRILFMLLKRDFPIEFKLFGVDSLVATNILPIIKSSFIRWMPGDRSAIEAILPWKNVFTSIEMNKLLSLSIVPKLERALQTINLHTTEKFVCLEIFEWAELLGSDFICDMIVTHFFPRFYSNLCSKLSSPNVLLSSVKEYYAAWKNLFPDHFVTTKSFRDQLTRALMAIHQVQNGSVLSPMSLPKNIDRTRR